MSERLSPERAVRLLRAKAAELEVMVPIFLDPPPPNPEATGQALSNLAADIALVAGLLADHIERSEQHDEQLRQMYGYVADKVIPQETREALGFPQARHE